MNTETKKVLDANISNAINNLANKLGAAVKEGRRTCVHCQHFNMDAELCNVANARPPAAVIAFGCPSFVEPVPF